MPKVKSWEEHKAECEAVAKEGITVLGFVEPWDVSRTKLICNCEKHGEWSTSSINNFKRGSSCPECRNELTGHRSRADVCDVVDKLQSKCQEKGYKYIGIVGEYKNNLTRFEYECPEHGIQSTVTHSFLSANSGCLQCARQGLRKANLKDDQVHIKAFMKTGKFLEGTVFTKSDRKDSIGVLHYWNVYCPICSNDEYVKAGVCSGMFEATLAGLKRGIVSCRCSVRYRYTKEQWEYRIKKKCKEKGYVFSKWVSERWGALSKFNYICPLHGKQAILPNNFIVGDKGCPCCAGKTQQECYINSIWDEDIFVGLKFGISVDSNNRLKKQNNKNLFQMKQMKVYIFPDVSSCKKAERACLKRLQCGIVSSRELKDGYSETTSLNNLEAVEEIFKEFGGILKQ